MTKLTLTNYVQGTTTLLDNKFIDEYMPVANGEYVKVYLVLQRMMGGPEPVTVTAIADHLDCPEQDVVRALKYWKKQNLVSYEEKQTEIASETPATPIAPVAQATPVAAQPSHKKTKRSQKNRKEFREIVHVAESYLCKTLNKTESEALIYYYDELGMSADLIEYLIESCADNGHRSIHYINTVALSWADNKITTVEEAKAASGQYNRNTYAILNAFGIKGRSPAVSEIGYIRRWNEEYGFTSDLIIEACDRTMRAIHQPSFDYAESILKNWRDRGVRTLKDIEALDVAHQKEKAAKKRNSQTVAARTTRSSFNNFKGRDYTDMDELAKKLIET